MSRLPSLSIRTRLLTAVSVVCVSLVALAAWGQWSNSRNIETTAALFDRAHAATEQGLGLRAAVSELRRLEASAMAIGTSNTNEVQRLRGLWNAEAAALKQTAAKLVARASEDAEVARLGEQLAAQVGAYAAALEPIILQLEGATIDSAVALAYAEQEAGKTTAMVDTTTALVQAQDRTLLGIRAEMAAGATRLSYMRLGLIGLTLAIFVPLIFFTLRSILGPLNEAVRAAKRIASGDLSRLAAHQGDDETAQLLTALSEMQGSLSRLVGQVRSTAESIHVASSEVASGNHDLSQRTEQTAGNLQQAASSMEQLTGTVSQSVDAAQQASRLAISAAEVAVRGGQVVAQVVATMDDINQSSRKIADIIGVIDGIAFQTNILALNAAVEAARAGEQGRGFAVVAGEVRSLAQRSADAAKEIKTLIGASVDKVQTGSELVSNAGRTMEEIVASVQRVSSMIGEISLAASEQSGGIGQISSSVAVLDKMTQQNAALVEQSAAAAESLEHQARSLSQLVATFRLEATSAKEAGLAA